jgi:hypothetical protein
MVSKAQRVTAAFVAVAVVNAWSGIARADCKNDAECKGDRVCEKGTCVAPAPAPVAAPPVPGAPAPAPVAAPPAPDSNLPPPSSPAGPTVQVAIRGTEGEAVTLEGLHARETCRAPCTVAVPPGHYTVRTKSRAEEVEITSRSSEVKIVSGCSACTIGGAIAVGVGVATTVAGAVMKGGAPDCVTNGALTYCVGSDGRPRMGPGDGDEDIGTALLVAGISVAVLGAAALITGLALGPSRVTVDGADASRAKRAPSPAPSLALTPRGVGFSF